MSESCLHVVFGAGQVGAALATRLARSGAAVRTVSRHRPPALPDGIDWRAADASDPEAATDVSDVWSHGSWLVRVPCRGAGRGPLMLYAFGFERIGVVAGDLYFQDPLPGAGQEGPEQGVRLEVRMIAPGELGGSVYSARPIAIGDPIWRADLLESVSRPGTLDRAHHHPRFRGWEPGRRQYVEEMTADPVAWVGKRLTELDALLEEAGIDRGDIGPSDADSLRHAVPEILEAVRRLLDGVRAGHLAQPQPVGAGGLVRSGWL